MTYYNNPKSLTRLALGRMVADVLDSPRPPTHNNEAVRAVNAIIKVLTDALLRGETIKIPGLGKFYIRTRKAFRHESDLFYKNKSVYRGTHIVPEQKKVAFIPSRMIKVQD